LKDDVPHFAGKAAATGEQPVAYDQARLGWRDVPVGALLTRQLSTTRLADIPLFVQNEADVAAVGEIEFNAPEATRVTVPEHQPGLGRTWAARSCCAATSWCGAWWPAAGCGCHSSGC